MFISPGILAANVLGGSGGTLVPEITDDFNRADDTELGTSAEGWSWTRVTGTAGHIGITNNWCYKIHGSGGTNRAEYDLAASDMYAQVDAVTHGSTGSNDADVLIMCRFDTATQTFYQGRYRNLTATNEDQYILHKRVAGTDTQIGSTVVEATAGLPITLRLEVEGNTLRFYGGGVLKIAATDSTITSGLRAGLGMGGGNAFACDNFQAGAL